jgi:hypothetical protein
MLGADIRRCHGCCSRRAWWGSFAIRVGQNSNQVSRMYSTAILGGGFVFCLAIMWWVVTSTP